MKSVRFITLGCRVNQYESHAMRESLENAGFHSVDKKEHRSSRSPVDFVIINTCTVTSAADRENLYFIRRAKRENPGAKIVVTGCFVEKNRSQIEKLSEVDLVISNHEKPHLSSFLSGSCGDPKFREQLVASKRQFAPLSISRSRERSRAYIKIQDGCNHACSFCKVVVVRGRSRSRPLQDIAEEACRLRDSGHREVVLTGIQLGAYGLEFSPSVRLADAIEACSRVDGIERIRLSSIEPTDVTPELIEILKSNPKCCPHLHIPLQSGDDNVLKKMNRRYGRQFYRDLVLRLKSEIKNFSLTLDVMAGFPGETEAAFQNTVDLLENVKPLKCHVFPYSAREGTRAFGFENVPESILRRRMKQLTALSDRLGTEERRRYLGNAVSVLVEKKGGKGAVPLLHGVSDNYLKVCFQGSAEMIGELIPVQLLTLQGPIFLGRLSEALVG